MHLYKHWASFLVLWVSLGYGYSPQELTDKYNIQLNAALKTAQLPPNAFIQWSGSYHEINFGATVFQHIEVTLEQGHYWLDADGESYAVILPHMQPSVPAPSFVPVPPPAIPPVMLMDASPHIESLSEKAKQLLRENEQLRQEMERLREAHQLLQHMQHMQQRESGEFKGQIAALNHKLFHARKSLRQSKNSVQQQERPEPSPPPPPPPSPPPSAPVCWPEVPSEVHTKNQATQTPPFDNGQQSLIEELRRQVQKQSRQINKQNRLLEDKEQALGVHKEMIRQLNHQLFEDSAQYQQSEEELLTRINNIERERPLSVNSEISTPEISTPVEEPNLPVTEEARTTEKVVARKAETRKARKKKKRRGKKELPSVSDVSIEPEHQPETMKKPANQPGTGENKTRNEKKKGKKSKAPKKSQASGVDLSANGMGNDDFGVFEEAAKASRLEDEARTLSEVLSSAIPPEQGGNKEHKNRYKRKTVLADLKPLHKYMEKLFQLQQDEAGYIDLTEHHNMVGIILQNCIKGAVGYYGEEISEPLLEDLIKRYFLLFAGFGKLYKEDHLWLLLYNLRDPQATQVFTIFRRVIKELWVDSSIDLWLIIAQAFGGDITENADWFHDHLALIVFGLFAEDFTMVTTMTHWLREDKLHPGYGLLEQVQEFFEDGDKEFYRSPPVLRILQDFQMIERLLDTIAYNSCRGYFWSEFDVTAVAATISGLYSALHIVHDSFKPIFALSTSLEFNLFTNEVSRWKYHCNNINKRAEQTRQVKRLKENKPDQPKHERLLSQFQAHLTEFKKPGHGGGDTLKLDPVNRFTMLELKPKYTPGDGHCLFHALVQQLSGVKNSGQEPVQGFISRLIEFAQQQSDYSETFGGFNTEPHENEGHNNLNTVVNQLLNAQNLESPLQQEAWGGHEILGLVSSYTGNPVLVVQAQHTMSGDGSIALLFEPGASEPVYLNFVETIDYLDTAGCNIEPVMLGFLQGDPDSGAGNHWFQLEYDFTPDIESNFYTDLSDSELPESAQDDNNSGHCSQACVQLIQETSF